MRFQARLCWWRALLPALLLGLVIWQVSLGAYHYRNWTLFFAILPWVATLPNTWPQYAEFRDDGLFLRSGFRKALMPYPALQAIRRTTYAPAVGYWFSTEPVHVIGVIGADRRVFSVAIAEEVDFLTEVLRRCPQLERWSFNLRRRFEART